MPNYEKAKDIFIQRKKSSGGGTFEEYPLIVSPNSVVTIDSANNLTVTPLSYFAQSSESISSSYSKTASVALNVPQTASHADTASYALYVSGSTNSVTASYANTSSIIVFNGNRSIKRSGYTGINVGGSDIAQFIENFFFPFIPSTISLTGGSSYYQTGSSVNVTLTATVTANDEVSFGTGSILKDGSEWYTSSTIPPLSFNKTDNGITSNHSYVAYAQVDNNGSPTLIQSSTRTISFIYPYLWGMSVTAGLSGSALYDAFTKQVVTSGNKTVSMVGSVVYMYFAYPTSYPVLTSILDPNSFEVISNFEYSSSVIVESTGLTNNWSNTYRVYRTRLVSDPNGNYQFNQ